MVERGANTDEYSSKDTDGMGAVYSCVEKSLRFHWGSEMAMWYSANRYMQLGIVGNTRLHSPDEEKYSPR